MKNEQIKTVEEIEIDLLKCQDQVAYYEAAILKSTALKNRAEILIVQTQTRKLTAATNQLDSQLQSLASHIRELEQNLEAANNLCLEFNAKLITAEVAGLNCSLSEYLN